MLSAGRHRGPGPGKGGTHSFALWDSEGRAKASLRAGQSHGRAWGTPAWATGEFMCRMGVGLTF